MKGQVDYKLPKKMKKRKQLDALVDTVKLPRTRKGSASVQELLDSDSSDNDEFSLQSAGSKRRNRCCAWQSVAAQIGLFMVTTACLTTCVGLVWVQWHIRHELESLRRQVISVENSNKATPPLITLQSQLATLNTTIMGVKTGQGSLQEMLESVSVLQQKFTTLENSVKELQVSVASTHDILDAPDKLRVLSETLAALGSDLKLANNTALRMESRVAALEKQAVENENKPDLSNSVDKQDFISYTANITSNFQSLLSMLDQQSTRITVLENMTQLRLSENPKVASNNSWVIELVNTMLEEKLSNLTAAGLDGDNISQAIGAVAGAMFVPIGEFLAFRSDIVNNLEKLNDTLEVLNDELDQVAGHLDNNTRTLTDLIPTIVKMSKGQQFPAFQDSQLNSSPSPSIPVQTSTSAATNSRAVHIEGINSLDELHAAFKKWPTDDGQISLSSLATLAGLNTEDLKLYDTDDTGSLNEEELAGALGLSHNPR